jgi:hypothetical protein
MFDIKPKQRSISCGRTTIYYTPGSQSMLLSVGDGQQPYIVHLETVNAVSAQSGLAEMVNLHGVDSNALAALQNRLGELFPS